MHLEILFIRNNLLNYTGYEKAHPSCQKVMQPGTVPLLWKVSFLKEGTGISCSPPSSFCSMKAPEACCLGNQISEGKNAVHHWRPLHFIMAAEPGYWLQTLVDPQSTDSKKQGRGRKKKSTEGSQCLGKITDLRQSNKCDSILSTSRTNCFFTWPWISRLWH